jgi:hypothetical protein
VVGRKEQTSTYQHLVGLYHWRNKEQNPDKTKTDANYELNRAKLQRHLDKSGLNWYDVIVDNIT